MGFTVQIWTSERGDMLLILGLHCAGHCVFDASHQHQRLQVRVFVLANKTCVALYDVKHWWLQRNCNANVTWAEATHFLYMVMDTLHVCLTLICCWIRCYLWCAGVVYGVLVESLLRLIQFKVTKTTYIDKDSQVTSGSICLQSTAVKAPALLLLGISIAALAYYKLCSLSTCVFCYQMGSSSSASNKTSV
jgi:hypothetical protein